MSHFAMPVAIRTRLLVIVLAAVALILIALVAGFNLALRTALDREATHLAQARARAVLATLDTTSGHVRVGETPDDAIVDAQVWVYDRTTLVEGPQASAVAADAAAAGVAAAAPGIRDIPKLRLASVPVAIGDRTIGAVVAAVALQPYDSTTRAALVASIALGLLLAVAIALITAWTLRRALRPVHEMTVLAAEWSERDVERRFSQGPPRDELTQLAATLDQLLGRLAASLRREQRFSAELAHELRTPLSRIRAECELALGQRDADPGSAESFADIARSADEMSRTIDALVAAARHGAGHQRGVTDAAAVLERLSRRARTTTDGLVTVEVRPVPAMRIAADADLVERIVAPLLENALRYAVGCVTLDAHREADMVVIVVDDDGPGVGAADRGLIFEPGARGAAARGGGGGAGLGLALARRLANDVAGSVELEPTKVGARFAVRLPGV
jgi:signal transduction histidine kinase